jgi:BlaI family transcriptional regulator, penicillinase repressor
LTIFTANAININVRIFNIKRKALTPLEQFLMDYVRTHPDCTAEACREGVVSRRVLKDSTIRTVLRSLEEKGYGTHQVAGRTFVYRAVDSRRNVAAAQQFIDRFCGGSVEDFLIGLVDNQVVQPKQLQRMAEKIAARKEGKS